MLTIITPNTDFFHAVCGMNKKGRILVNLGQFEDTPTRPPKQYAQLRFFRMRKCSKNSISALFAGTARNKCPMTNALVTTFEIKLDVMICDYRLFSKINTCPVLYLQIKITIFIVA